VACGYSQIPGVDFNENFAPVLNYVWNMKLTVVDIETAFLHGNLDEEIYMDAPKGLLMESNKKLILRKKIYGLVQSARKFYEKLIEILKLIGFYESQSDPCLGL
jgi:Reverse transcriptase (RNA-dependent DNA polymerase)